MIKNINLKFWNSILHRDKAKGVYDMKKLLMSLIALFVATQIVYADELSDIKYRVSELQYQNKNQEAINVINSALKKYPNDAELYIHRAKAKDDLNQKQSAIADLNKAIQLNPKSDDAYFWRAAIKDDLNNISGAKQDISACLSINPNNGGCMWWRGLLKFNTTSDISDAEADFEKARMLDNQEIDNILNER